MINDLIYLASPYTHPSVVLRQSRAMRIAQVAAQLVKKGLFVYSPVLHGHEIDKWGDDIPYQYWIDLGLKMLNRCDSLYVVLLPGWKDSKGIQKEVDFAIQMQKPVYYYAPVTDTLMETEP